MPPLPPASSFGRLTFSAPSVSDEERVAKVFLGIEAVDSSVREDAEEELCRLNREHPPAFVRALVTLTVKGYPPAASVRAQAALVIRLYLPFFWYQVDAETRQWVKLRLPGVLSESSPREIRYPIFLSLVAVAQCVSSGGGGGIFSYDMEQSGNEKKEQFTFSAWPEFSGKLFANFASPAPHDRRNALEVVGILANSDDCTPASFDDHASVVMNGLHAGLTDFAPENRLAAVFCTVYMFGAVANSDTLPVKSLSPLLLNVLMGFVEEGHFDFAISVLDMFVEERTWYWESDLVAFGRALLHLIALPGMKEDDDKRRVSIIALEAVFTIFEIHERDFLEPCRFLCIPLFNTCAEALLDPDNTDACEDAKISLTRLATALGGVDITDVASQCLGPFINSLSWQHRHAGVCAIAEIHEAAVGAFQPEFDNIVNGVQHLQHNDPHPRVRSAAALTFQTLTSPPSGGSP